MTSGITDSFDGISHADLIGVVRDLVREFERVRGENEALGAALAQLRVGPRALKDELARLKHLPSRPKIKPSGMEKATQADGSRDGWQEGRTLGAAVIWTS